MDNLNAFDSLNEFFSSHPDVQLDELLHLSESLRYYKRLNANTLNDIYTITSYKKLCKVAAELEINRYKDYTVNVLKSMMIEKFSASFARRNNATEVPLVIITSEQQQKEDEQKEEEKVEEKKERETKRKRKENPEGSVYVFSNAMYAHYGANVYKIGYSGDAEERVHDFDTGYTESANIVYTFKHVNARCLEQRVHKALDMFRLFPNREFFKCALPVIKAMIEYLATTM